MAVAVEIGGIIIIVGALLHAFAGIYGFAVRAGRMARQGAEELELFRARAKIVLDRAAAERERSELSWNGKRKFEVVRREIENPAGDICSFYLAPHDKRPIPPFRPGQFLTFELPIPGQPGPTVRCYSLSDSPLNRDFYRVSIKKLGPPPKQPDAPPGLSSNFFHNNLKEGEIVEVMAPAGEFFLNEESERPVVLIGGGVGLTPVVSMLNSIVASGSRREVWFFYGVRNRNEHAMYDHLKQIAKDNDNVHVVVCYSQPSETCREGIDYDRKGFVSVDLIKSMVASNNYEFYICGPPPMMEMITQHLEEWGVPESDINFEAFGPATVKKTQEPASEAEAGAAQAIKVVFSRSNKTVQWGSGAETLLELGEANGIRMNCGCRSGSCGTCLTALKQGEVEYIYRPGKQPEAGSCLTCISRPKADIVLDA